LSILLSCEAGKVCENRAATFYCKPVEEKTAMAQIHSIELQGYKSFRNLFKSDFKSINILIGANGVGKSNFINFFRMLSAIYEKRLQYYVQKHGGPDALLHFGRKKTDYIRAEIGFAPKEGGFYYDSYLFNLFPTNDNRLIFEKEEIYTLDVVIKDISPLPSPIEFPRLPLGLGHAESLLDELKNRDIKEVIKEKLGKEIKDHVPGWNISSMINTLKNLRVYHFHDTSESAKVKQRHASNDNLQLKTDAANLAAYLRRLYKEYPDEYQRIVATIRLVLPFFADFVHRPGDTEYIELEWTQVVHPDTPLKAHMLSDGSLRFICLATLLLQPVELLPDTILIDEPELGLHPYAIVVLADIIKQVAEEKQLIISTQSVELINEFSPEDIIVVDQEDDASVFKRLSREALDAWLEEYTLGELWKQNVFGGRP